MNDDSPMLYNRSLILSNLSMLSKHQCLFTARLEQKNLFLTSIVEVSIQSNTLFLDTSVSDTLNSKLLSLRRVKFSSVFNGVQVAFTGESIEKRKKDGYDVFAMPIPKSLYWFNRRSAYRVAVPSKEFSICKLPIFPLFFTPNLDDKHQYNVVATKIKKQLAFQLELESIEDEKKFLLSCAELKGKELYEAKLERAKLEAERKEHPVLLDENLLNIIQLRLFDISISGCALVNTDEDFSYFLKPQTLYKNCKIVMQNHGEINISLRLITKRTLDEDSKNLNELVCFKFVDVEQSAESVIFRYIQALDRMQKKHIMENLLTIDFY